MNEESERHDRDVSKSGKDTVARLRVADFESALARVGGNRKLLTEMIGFFREDVPQLYADVEGALADGDARRLKRAAHSIKGLAASFDAERVTSRSLEIERLAEQNQLDEIPSKLPPLQAAITELDVTLREFENS